MRWNNFKIKCYPLQVVGFFSSRLVRVQDQRGGELGVSEVLEVISKGASQWSSDRLRVKQDTCSTLEFV